MPESEKSFQIDPEQKRDKYRSYDASVFWNDTDGLEKLRTPTEVDSIILKSRDRNSRVFSGSGPKAYHITDVERMDELDCAHQAMKFHDVVDPRMEQIITCLLDVLSKQDPKKLDDFFCGNKKITLKIPLNSLPVIDFAKGNFSKLAEHQTENYYERKFWPKNVFQYQAPGLLLNAIYKSPLFEKLKSAREKQYGLKWAHGIWFSGSKYKMDSEQITLDLTSNKPDLEMQTDYISKDGETYVVDASKYTQGILHTLVYTYSKNSKICPVKIIGNGLEKAKVLFDEIKRLSDLNTEDSKRQALSLQNSIGPYLSNSYRKEKIRSRKPKRQIEWTIDGQKVEEEVKIRGKGDVLSKYGTEISKKIEKDGMTFLLTPLRKRSGVMECVFYVIKDGILYPRLAYQSRSHKRWRIDTFISLSDHRGKGLFSYTIETVPFIELDEALENLEKESVVLEERCDRDLFLKDKSIHTYKHEVERDLPVLYDFANFTTNDFPHNTKEADDLMNPDYIPDDFIPDFKGEPIAVRNREEIIIEQFHHTFRGIELDFHIARDKDGRVWVDRLEKTLKAGDLTTYGTRKKSLEFGPLSMKPFDYPEQVSALNPNDEIYIISIQAHLSGRILPNPSRPIQAIHTMGSDYADITPFFDQLKLIQRYREQREVVRKSL